MLDVEVEEPGVYRAEAYRRARGRERTWADAAALGLVAAAVPEKLGGASGSVEDAAVALEAAAEALVPGPLLPTVMAGLLLARHADPITAKQVVPRLADGSRPAAVALGPGQLRAWRGPNALKYRTAVTPIP